MKKTNLQIMHGFNIATQEVSKILECYRETFGPIDLGQYGDPIISDLDIEIAQKIWRKSAKKYIENETGLKIPGFVSNSLLAKWMDVIFDLTPNEGCEFIDKLLDLPSREIFDSKNFILILTIDWSEKKASAQFLNLQYEIVPIETDLPELSDLYGVADSYCLVNDLNLTN